MYLTTSGPFVLGVLSGAGSFGFGEIDVGAQVRRSKVDDCVLEVILLIEERLFGGCNRGPCEPQSAIFIGVLWPSGYNAAAHRESNGPYGCDQAGRDGWVRERGGISHAGLVDRSPRNLSPAAGCTWQAFRPGSRHRHARDSNATTLRVASSAYVAPGRRSLKGPAAICASIVFVEVLVLLAHPDPDSLCHSIAGDVKQVLTGSGHEVTLVDLYADGFEPVMTEPDRVAYETDHPIVDPEIQRHADLVRSSQGLVFIYPTVVGGLPAMLKGWLDRVLVTGVAFELDERTNKIKPAMRHVRCLGAVTTSPARRIRSASAPDAGRRTLTRTLRLIVRPTARSSWNALYRADRRSEPEQNVFRDRVRKSFQSW